MRYRKCVMYSGSVETCLEMLLEQDGWNEVKGFVGGGRSITLLWEVMSEDWKKRLMGDTEVIVFGRFLLDYVPIKLNKFNGVGGKMLVETARGDGREGDIDGRVERKGIERKRLLHYRDQLLGTVSYGICCTKCHVTLLHWDSVWGKREIINHTERERKWGKESKTKNQKSIKRKNEVKSLERKERGRVNLEALSSLLLSQPSTLSISACLALSSVEPIKVDDSVTHHW